jgi:hypothetical protein
MDDQTTEPEAEEPAPAAKPKAKQGGKKTPNVVWKLTDEVNAVRALKEAFGPMMEEDPELAACMVEGETGFIEAVQAIIVSRNESLALAEMADKLSDTYAERKKRFEARAKALRETLATALEAAKETSVPTGAGTVSLSDAPVIAIIENEVLVPSRFWVTPPQPEKRIDKNSLNAEIKLGPIPGCRESEPRKIATIKTK